MLINTEALTQSFSPSRASSPGVVSGLVVGSLSSRTNASLSASSKALPPGTQQTSVVVVGAALVATGLATNESEIPRQNSAIPITSSRKARTPPTPTLSSPCASRGIGSSRSHHWLPRPCWVPVFPKGGVQSLYLVPDVSSPIMAPQRGAGRITQMNYLSQLSSRSSENAVWAKFAECLFHALR